MNDRDKSELEIFLSHSSRDKPFVDVLVAEISNVFDLPEASIETVIFNSSSPYSIRLGSTWLETVFEALGTARVLVPLITPSAEKSMWVAFEYGYFWRRKDVEKGLQILPLVHTIHPASPLNQLEHKRVTDTTELQLFFDGLRSALGREFVNEPQLGAIVDQAKTIRPLTAEDEQYQLECTLLLKTSPDNVKQFIIDSMKARNILHHARLVGTELLGIGFVGANMQGTDMGECDLREANFWATNLEDAILGGACIKGASFEKVSSLKNTSMQEVRADGTTKLPDGNFYKENLGLAQFEKWGAKIDG